MDMVSLFLNHEKIIINLKTLSSWMSRWKLVPMVSNWVISPTYKSLFFFGGWNKPLILTIGPNFQRDIQVVSALFGRFQTLSLLGSRCNERATPAASSVSGTSNQWVATERDGLGGLGLQKCRQIFQEISNRTHGPQTPKKAEYLMARSLLTEQGPLVRSHSIFDGNFVVSEISEPRKITTIST